MKRVNPFPITQTEYDCPAQRGEETEETEDDPLQRVLLWLAIGFVACSVVLLFALGWVVVFL